MEEEDPGEQGVNPIARSGKALSPLLSHLHLGERRKNTLAIGLWQFIKSPVFRGYWILLPINTAVPYSLCLMFKNWDVRGGRWMSYWSLNLAIPLSFCPICPINHQPWINSFVCSALPFKKNAVSIGKGITKCDLQYFGRHYKDISKSL